MDEALWRKFYGDISGGETMEEPLKTVGDLHAGLMNQWLQEILGEEVIEHYWSAAGTGNTEQSAEPGSIPTGFWDSRKPIRTTR